MTHKNNSKTQLMSESALSFGPFRVEAAKHLWRGDQLIGLRPRSLAMLRYLAERPGQLVTKKELLTRLWPGIYVSPTVIKVCVREIRHALGDNTAKPQFIETVGTQGYRFISPLTTLPPVLSPQSPVPSQITELTPSPRSPTPNFVGREHEVAQLHAWYERVQQGERQIIFVSGEAGIGKTTLVEHFLAQGQIQRPVRIGHGHCVEQGEHGEAYLPVLQALQRLCSAPDGDQVVAILRRYAPLWLLQLTGIIDEDERERLQRQVEGSSPQRMVRELVQAIKELTAELPLILFFDDMQWGDTSTLDLIAYLAQSSEPTRLLVISTYRPADAILRGSPLRRVVQSLVGRRKAQELVLELLTQAEVETYLNQRLAGSPVVDVLGPVIHRRTDGNALFVMHFVDYLLQQNLLVEAAGNWELRVEPAVMAELIPDNVHRLLIMQIERSSGGGQQLLAVASVVGLTFTASEVAAVANRPLEVIEAEYNELAAQEQFIEARGLAEWPDGSVTVRYHFRHALYQQALYHRIGLGQRVRWHRQLGEHFVAMFGGRTREIADELALHFERGRGTGTPSSPRYAALLCRD